MNICNRFVTASINARWAIHFEKMISDLYHTISERKNPQPTRDDLSQIKEWQKEANYYREEQRRYNLAGLVSGREYVSVK